MEFGTSCGGGKDAVWYELDEESSHTSVGCVDGRILQSSRGVRRPVVHCSWWRRWWRNFRLGILRGVLKSGEMEELMWGHQCVRDGMSSSNLGSLMRD